MCAFLHVWTIFQNNAPKTDQQQSPTSKPTQPQTSQQKGPVAAKKAAKTTNASGKQADNVKAKSNIKAKSNVNKTAAKKPTADGTEPKSLAEDLKTDAGAASDESWEKDFDLGDP